MINMRVFIGIVLLILAHVIAAIALWDFFNKEDEEFER